MLPVYSTILHLGERLLDQNLPSRSTGDYVDRSTGDYVRRVGRSTLTLHGQEPGAEIPTYGREARITGAVLIAESETVSGVELQVRGKIDVTVADLGCTTAKTLRKIYTLWPHDGGPSKCPDTLPLSLFLPPSFRDANYATFDLPPTCDFTLPGFFAKSVHSISIVVTRSDPRFQALSSEQMISVPFNYSPALHIPPLPQNPTRVSAEKVEWRKTSSRLAAEAPVTGQALALSVSLPAKEPFDLKLPIPFYIQLTGPLQHHFRTHTSDGVTGVKCWIQRNIIINFHGRPTTRTIIVGNSIPRTCSPAAAGISQGSATLLWNGELRCDPHAMVGGFNAGLLKIQDYVVVEITTSEHGASQMNPLRHMQRIELATSASHH
ncbi:hypothetical protein B0H11DRAFT_1962971 [Mycena galericulata]|nr:hypothetical protein B0H11DRAFT_1962971 [Mycena galericulata]